MPLPNEWLHPARLARLRMLVEDGDEQAIKALRHFELRRKAPPRSRQRKFHQGAFIRAATKALDLDEPRARGSPL